MKQLSRSTRLKVAELVFVVGSLALSAFAIARASDWVLVCTDVNVRTVYDPSIFNSGFET